MKTLNHFLFVFAALLAFFLDDISSHGVAYAADPAPAPKGYALSIGLNQVGSFYQDLQSLEGAENDARDMIETARKTGFTEVNTLFSKQATKRAVKDAILKVANAMKPTDIFMISYSGHGMQVPDMTGLKKYGLSSTWCLYDDLMLDHELFDLWHSFPSGARILVFSDSCHSGTVIKAASIGELSGMPREINDLGLENVNQAQNSKEAANAEDGIMAVQSDTIREFMMGILKLKEKEANQPPSGPKFKGSILGRINRNATIYRGVPFFKQSAILQQNEEHIRQLVLSAKDLRIRENDLGATVLLISACQDWERAGDLPDNGVFTYSLKQIWGDGSQFHGNYKKFRDEIRNMTALNGQNPNYYTVGPSNSRFEGQTPFTVVDQSP
jgi:metacaspase-1